MILSAVLFPLDNNYSPTDLLFSLVLTEEDVKKILLQLDTSKAWGPFLINPKLPKILPTIPSKMRKDHWFNRVVIDIKL